MGNKLISTPDYVIGLDGRILRRADLPSSETKRWVARRKAEVVIAVQGGLLSLDEACSRYRLSLEEYLSWHRAIARDGLNGARVMRAKDERNATLQDPS